MTCSSVHSCNFFTVLLCVVLMVGFSSTNYTVNEGEASVDVEVFQFLPSFAVQFVVYIFIPGLDTRKKTHTIILAHQNKFLQNSLSFPSQH